MLCVRGREERAAPAVGEDEALCVVLYAGSCGRYALFAERAGDDALYAALHDIGRRRRT